MKLYVLRSNEYDSSRSCVAYYRESYTNKQLADMTATYYYGEYTVEEIDLPFIGRSVCYVAKFQGTRHTWPNGIYNPAVSNEYIECSNVYSCTEHAKNDKMWKEIKDRVNLSPSDFTIYDDEISTGKFDMYDGHSFDIIINRIRVVKN